MAEQLEPIKIAKAKVLSVSPGEPWKLGGKDMKSWNIVLQDVDNPATVITAECSQQVLPDEVKQDAVIEDVTIDRIAKKDGSGHYNKVKFVKPDQQDGGGGGRRYGPSPEEMKLKYDEAVWKVIGVGYSYGVQLALSMPKESLNDMVEDACKAGDAIVDKMWEKFNQKR